MNVEPNDVLELTNATMVYLTQTSTMIPQMILIYFYNQTDNEDFQISDIFPQTQSYIMNSIFTKRIIHTNNSNVILYVDYLWKIA